jgi:hypothetical protein
LTSGVEDCEMAGTVGFEGGSGGGGTGHQGGHYQQQQQQQQQQQGGQRRSENNNWEESALAITGMFADSQLRMRIHQLGCNKVIAMVNINSHLLRKRRDMVIRHSTIDLLR